MWLCPYCESVNEDTDHVCIVCERRPDEKDGEFRYCTNCGTKYIISNENKFCINCGSKLNSNDNKK